MIRLALVGIAALVSLGSARAGFITQWNFNGPSAAAVTLTPSIGTGSISLVGGVTSPGFNNGVGSSDPVLTSPPNYAYQTTTYAAQGAGTGTRGIQVNVSTVGFTGISIGYDLRHSNTSSRYEQFQYSTDGTTFVDFGSPFDGNAGDTWFNGRTVDLSGVAGVENNANFAYRVVAVFAPSTSSYAPSNPTSTYAATGTWRFDMVSVSGTPVSVVPAPASAVLLLAAVPALAAFRRRRPVTAS
jgi:hypothetical protein